MEEIEIGLQDSDFEEDFSSDFPAGVSTATGIGAIQDTDMAEAAQPVPTPVSVAPVASSDDSGLQDTDMVFDDAPPVAEEPLDDTPSPDASYAEQVGFTSEDAGMGRKALQLATSPIRAARAGHVGIQRLIENATGEEDMSFTENLMQASERTQAAFKPGFVPQDGERIGAIIGETAATAPLFAGKVLSGMTPLKDMAPVASYLHKAGAPAASAVAKVLPTLAKDLAAPIWNSMKSFAKAPDIAEGIARMFVGGASAGTLAAVQVAAERGEVEFEDMIVPVAAGGLAPVIVPLIFKGVGNLAKDTGKVSVSVPTSVERGTVDTMRNQGGLLNRYAGTQGSVRNAAVKIQEAVKAQHKRAGEVLEKVRKQIGFKEPFEDSLSRIEAEGFVTPDAQTIASDFKALRKGTIQVVGVKAPQVVVPKKVIPARETTTFSNSPVRTAPQPGHPDLPAQFPAKSIQAGQGGQVGESGAINDIAEQMEWGKWSERARANYFSVKGQSKEVVRKAITKKGSQKTVHLEMDPKMRLRDLIRLRQQTDDLIRWGVSKGDDALEKISTMNQGALKVLRSEINDTISTIPGGKRQRWADAGYHELRKLYDDFQRNFTTPGKSEDIVNRIGKGGGPEQVIGKKGEYARTLKNVDLAEGKRLGTPGKVNMTDDLGNEIATQNLRTMEPTGIMSPAFTALGPEGSEGAALATDAFGGAMKAFERSGKRPLMQGLMKSAAANLVDKGKKKKKKK